MRRLKAVRVWLRCLIRGHDMIWFYRHCLDARTVMRVSMPAEAQFLRIGKCCRCGRLMVEPDPRKEVPDGRR